MSSAASQLADIDRPIAKGGWWSRMRRGISKAGRAVARVLGAEVRTGGRRRSAEANRIARASNAGPKAAAETDAREKARAWVKALRDAQAAQAGALALEASDHEATDHTDPEHPSAAPERRLGFGRARAGIAETRPCTTLARIFAALMITPSWTLWEAEISALKRPARRPFRRGRGRFATVQPASPARLQ